MSQDIFLIEELKKSKFSIFEIYEDVENNANVAIQAIEKILLYDIQGSAVSFLQLIDLLIGQKNYFAAHVLCRYALNKYKCNIDICASLIETSIEMIETEKLVGAIIQDITSDLKNKKYWNRRLYVALCHYYYHMMQISPWEDKERYFKEGRKYAAELKEFDMLDEEGYFWEV